MIRDDPRGSRPASRDQGLSQGPAVREMMGGLGTPRIVFGPVRALKVFLAVASAVVFMASCTGTQRPPAPSVSSSGGTPAVEPAQSVTDMAAFMTALEASGHTVRREGVVDLVGFEGLASFGRKISIDGVRVWALEYSSSDFNKVHSNISKDAHEMGDAQVFWSPHIYGTGKLTVVGFGPARTVRTLDELLGPQFAGV